MELQTCRISPRNRSAMAQMDALLEKQGIERDKNLAYSVGIYDDDRLVATGSFFENSLRCLAVDSEYQGQGLLNQVVSELSGILAQRGVFHLFVYTKCRNAMFFSDIGYSEICRVDDKLVFMENRRDGFESYLAALEQESQVQSGRTAAVVMNANPFTHGHRFLVETAAKSCDTLHLFVVTQQASPIPFEVRYRLVRDGVSHIKNVVLHQTGSYLISGATFPSYFLRDHKEVMRTQAALDVTLFTAIAKRLGITMRFVGEEPNSVVTAIYNDVMKQKLIESQISLTILDRMKQVDSETPISASTVRRLLQQGRLAEIAPLVPQTTYDFFASNEAKAIIDVLQGMADVVHH